MKLCSPCFSFPFYFPPFWSPCLSPWIRLLQSDLIWSNWYHFVLVEDHQLDYTSWSFYGSRPLVGTPQWSVGRSRVVTFYFSLPSLPRVFCWRRRLTGRCNFNVPACARICVCVRACVRVCVCMRLYVFASFSFFTSPLPSFSSSTHSRPLPPPILNYFFYFPLSLPSFFPLLSLSLSLSLSLCGRFS